MAGVMETDACRVVERPVRNGSDKIRLQSMRSVLVQGLDIIEIEQLLDVLFGKDIITTEEKNIVFYEPVPESKMRKLLDILETKVDNSRDPPVLDVVAGFLDDPCGKEELAKELLEADGTPKGHKESAEALKLAEGMELSDKILGGVVRQIGTSWEGAAHELGVTDVRIGNIKSVTTDPYQQKFKVFNSWRQASGYHPWSLVDLLKALADCEQCTVDWPRICKYLKSNKNQ